MRTIHRRLVGALLTVLIAAVTVIAPSGATQAAMMGDLNARMHPTSAYPDAHGGAWYEGHRGWREFSIHVRGIQGLAGNRVTVSVHGAFVGRMRVSSSGAAHLYRRHGMPRCGRGDMIRVRTAGGNLMTSGRLRHRHHHMM